MTEPNRAIAWAHRRIAARKNAASPPNLDGWETRELISFGRMMVACVLRGLYCKLRFKEARGLVYCERNVRIDHPRHISAGRDLNLDEGCQIVGLSRRGIRFGDRCTVGRYAAIRPTSLLLGELGEGLCMGSHSNIGAFSYIGCSGYIEIGDYVMMGPRVNLMAENHVFDRTDVPMKQQGVRRLFIRIEDDCWLGVNSTVVAGVTVGRGSIVAAGAVVTHDIPPWSVAAGVPARVIRQRKPGETGV